MNSEISKKFSAWGRVRLDPAPPPISHLQEAKVEQRDPGDHLPAKACLGPPLAALPTPVDGPKTRRKKKGGRTLPSRPLCVIGRNSIPGRPGTVRLSLGLLREITCKEKEKRI